MLRLTFQMTAALLLALFLSSCGGGESGSQDTETSMQSTGDDVRTIEVTGTDDMKFRVDPSTQGAEVRDDNVLDQILVSPGERIRITLTTESDLPATAMGHNFVLLAQNADSDQFAMQSATAPDNDYLAPDLEDQIIAATEMLAGGESDTIEFEAPTQTGEFDFICSFPGHYSAGMYGVLVVQ